MRVTPIAAALLTAFGSLSAAASPVSPSQKVARIRLPSQSIRYVGDAMLLVREAARVAGKPVEAVFHEPEIPAHFKSFETGIVVRASPPGQEPIAGEGHEMELKHEYFWANSWAGSKAVEALQNEADTRKQPVWALHIPQPTGPHGRPLVLREDEKAPIVLQAYPSNED